MAKKFMYKGKTLEELQAMKTEDFIRLLSSRQRRTLKRGLDARRKKFYQKVKRVKAGDTNMKLRTHARDVVITPDMVDLTIEVYNGKEWSKVTVKPEMIGHYLGEFALTRKKVTHGMPGMGATKSSLYVPLK